jgi:hypothetical protein
MIFAEGRRSEGVTQLEPEFIRRTSDELPLGASADREEVGFPRGLQRLWKALFEWGSLLHVLFLLILLVTPSVAGALWGPTWGVMLGGAAMLLWFMFGNLSHRGIISWCYYLAGSAGILLQFYYQLGLTRRLLPHAG